MKAYGVIAAALAAFAMGTLHITPSLACTDSRCPQKTVVAAGKPLQLTKQKDSARAVVKESRRKKRSRAPKKAPVEEAVAAETETDSDKRAEAASDNRSDDTPLPVLVVRTTRESNEEPVVSAEELNDLDRAASPTSLLTSTIANYLGRPDITDEFDAPPAVSAEDFSSEAKEAFAAAPEPQKPARVALEHILMTFGGALAAASAIRLFVV
ncbi:MAG: hypothetical protein RO009_13830 [Pseudorhodoplanes sp.]|jgi:hypothetical protein|nr:hypothetical protein [Pseudorhodoplanes sp.]